MVEHTQVAFFFFFCIYFHFPKRQLGSRLAACCKLQVTQSSAAHARLGCVTNRDHNTTGMRAAAAHWKAARADVSRHDVGRGKRIRRLGSTDTGRTRGTDMFGGGCSVRSAFALGVCSAHTEGGQAVPKIEKSIFLHECIHVIVAKHR